MVHREPFAVSIDYRAHKAFRKVKKDVYAMRDHSEKHKQDMNLLKQELDEAHNLIHEMRQELNLIKEERKNEYHTHHHHAAAEKPGYIKTIEKPIPPSPPSAMKTSKVSSSKKSAPIPPVPPKTVEESHTQHNALFQEEHLHKERQNKKSFWKWLMYKEDELDTIEEVRR